MRNLVEGFAEIKQYGVDLRLVIQPSSQVMSDQYQLRFARAAFTEPMLSIVQDIMCFKVCHSLTVDDVL